MRSTHSTSQATAAGATLLVATACGAAVALVDFTNLQVAMAVLMAGSALVAGYAWLTASDRIEWLHPLGLPMLYVGFVLVVPVVFVATTGRSLGSLLHPDVISAQLAYALLLGFVALVAGILVGMRSSGRSLRPERPRTVDYVLLRRVGLALLLVAIPVQLYVRWETSGLAFGEHNPYGLLTAADRLTRLLVLPGTALAAIGGAALWRRMLGRGAGVIVAAAGVSVLLSGFRSVALMQLLILAAIYQLMIAKLRLHRVALLLGVILALMVGIGALRQGKPALPGELSEFYHRALSPFSSPAGITGILLERVPEGQDYALGETYVEAIKYQPPGPLARVLFGAEPRTGAFVFRDLSDRQDAAVGVSFAYIGEAYLNFGWAGIGAMMFLLGWAFGWTGSKLNPLPTRPLHMAYLFMVTLLPVEFRADALAQLKQLITIAAVTMFAFWVASQRRPAAAAPAAPALASSGMGGLSLPQR